MSIQDTILQEINEYGYFLLKPKKFQEFGETIDQMVADGIIESIRSAGIKFINEDYFFILKGNPAEIFVKNEAFESWLEKGIDQ